MTAFEWCLPSSPEHELDNEKQLGRYFRREADKFRDMYYERRKDGADVEELHALQLSRHQAMEKAAEIERQGRRDVDEQ